MELNNTVHIHGRAIRLPGLGSSYDNSFTHTMLPIRSLRKGYLKADNKQGLWEYVFAGIMGGIGLVFFIGGIFMILSAFGVFPNRESGFWTIGLPGIISLIIGVWLALSGMSLAIAYTILFINGDQMSLQEVVFGKQRPLYTKTISPDDYLICHLRDDAEQDIYSVSLDLVIPEWKKSITLFLKGVSYLEAPGRSYKKGMQAGLTRSTKKAFDKAKEIEFLLKIPIRY